MNWIRIDDTTSATELPGVGCFVRFFSSAYATFVPGVTIKSVGKTGRELVAMPFNSTHISFTTDTTTSPAGWVGNAGDVLDKKLAEYERKQWRADKVAKNQAKDAHPCPYCKRGFKWAALLRKHMASEHKA